MFTVAFSSPQQAELNIYPNEFCVVVQFRQNVFVDYVENYTIHLKICYKTIDKPKNRGYNYTINGSKIDDLL